MSSGDAFLAPKRENTVSPILFHFNAGDKIGRGSEGRREGGRDNETEREAEEGRWDAGLIRAVKLLQWAGGQSFSHMIPATRSAGHLQNKRNNPRHRLAMEGV